MSIHIAGGWRQDESPRPETRQEVFSRVRMTNLPVNGGNEEYLTSLDSS